MDTTRSVDAKENTQANAHRSHSAVSNTQKERQQEQVTTESIVQELLAQGLRLDQIVMPGGAKDILIRIADDFDAPLDEFEDYG